jgi:hypothetical protein
MKFRILRRPAARSRIRRTLDHIQFPWKLNVVQLFAWSHFRTENRVSLFLKMLYSGRTARPSSAKEKPGARTTSQAWPSGSAK